MASRVAGVKTRPVLIVLRVMAGALILCLMLGFLIFAGRVEQREAPLTRHAEGMIVLTGGADRVTDAIELFARGHADRLLITGVNQAITRSEIARLNPKFRELIDCCIDLGYDALNTIGNAREARRWADQHGISKSLIVVTSNYHMPRALAELSHALPNHELIPYGVVASRMRDEVWWRSAHAARIIGTEYLKYVVALTRLATADMLALPRSLPPA